MAHIGQYAKAIFDFAGEASSDLSLSVGDVVKITNSIDDSWAEGSKVGSSSSGNFPWSFVELLSLPTSVITGQKIFLALEDFPAHQIGDLELNKGKLNLKEFILFPIFFIFCSFI